MIKMDSADVESLYAYAYEQYVNTELQSALMAFSVLYSKDPLETRYVLGLAMTAYYLGEFELCEPLFTSLCLLSDRSLDDDLFYLALTQANLGKEEEFLATVKIIEPQMLNEVKRHKLEIEINNFNKRGV